MTREEFEVELDAFNLTFEARLAAARTDPITALDLGDEVMGLADRAIEIWDRPQGPRLVHSVSPSTVRKRRYERRRRAGLAVWRLELHENPVIEALIEADYVDEAGAGNRATIETAAAKVLHDWAARWGKTR
jgi:hypothetical protein